MSTDYDDESVFKPKKEYTDIMIKYLIKYIL